MNENKTRLYFYKEGSKLKLYIYCTLCGKGPFKQDDLRKDKVFFIAGKRTKIYYCPECKSHQTKIKTLK